jgi:hypothetical protein
VLVPAALLLLATWLGRAWWRGPLSFDDSYMFWRYALHLRQGLGLAWNPDGVPTYGLTSLPWVLGVLPFTWGPLPAGMALPLASWLAGLAAIAVMATAVARQAGSVALRAWPVAFAAVALPLGLVPVFAAHLTSGMDTTLSLLANAAVVWALVRWLDRSGAGRAVLVGLLGFAAVLVRPEKRCWCGRRTGSLRSVRQALPGWPGAAGNGGNSPALRCCRWRCSACSCWPATSISACRCR